MTSLPYSDVNLPFWNSTSITFMWVVLGITCLAALVIVVLMVRESVQQRTQTIWEAVVVPVGCLAFLGAVAFFLIAGFGWLATVSDYEEGVMTKHIRTLGYERVFADGALQYVAINENGEARRIVVIDNTDEEIYEFVELDNP